MNKYIDALNQISPNISRDKWVKTAMACKAENIDFEVWDAWSRDGDSYNEKDAIAVWRSADETGGITGGTLLHMAGYEPKQKNGFIQAPTSDYRAPANATPSPDRKNNAVDAEAIFSSYPAAADSHAYIIRKQGWPDGLKVVPMDSTETIRGASLSGALVIPCYEGDRITTLQYILDNQKLNLAGASFGAGYFMQGADKSQIYVCEGIGQLWAAIEASGKSAVSTFGASRTNQVVGKLKADYPKAEIILCPDVGQESKAETIAKQNGVKYIHMPAGWDKNSDINDLMLRNGIPALKSLLERPQSVKSIFDISKFVLNGESKKMEAEMLKDAFILGRMAILGQWTVFYAKPNAGKTLLTLWLLIQAIKDGKINGKDVFYINADDNHKGLVHKLKLAEENGFNMLAPSYYGFKPQMLTSILHELINSNKASGKVIILDTLKKFNDIMQKSQSSAFGEAIRAFISHGGSVIALAHVNKHRDDANKVIFSGTSDIVDDADCTYTLDIIKDETGVRTVMFENFKSRGDNTLSASFEYNCKEGTPYHQRLDSIKCLSNDEVKAAYENRKMNTKLESNREAIEAITACLIGGVSLKTELINTATENSMISKAKITKALKEHTGLSYEYGERWRLDVGDKNSHHYYLIRRF